MTLPSRNDQGPFALLEQQGSPAIEDQLRLAMECADMGIWSYDPATGIFAADPRVQEMFGATQQNGDLRFWLALVHPDDRDRVAHRFADALSGQQPYDLEYRVMREDGEHWMRSKGRVIGKADAVMFAVVEDITGRRRLEEELRISEETMSLAQNAAGIASWDWNVATGKIKWHPQGTQVYGRSAEELGDLDAIVNLICEEDRDSVRQEANTALEGKGDFQAEYRITWPDGSRHWLIARGKPITSDSRVTRILGVTMDVTERRKAEIALRQSEKLAAVGKLASSIAHEINNPLESVTNLLFLLRGSTNLDEIQEYAETAERELRRVSLIANQTLKFRKQLTKSSPFYCHDLIGEALALLQGRLVNRHIHVEKRKRATQPIQCFGDEIRQVLSNLFGNAIDSMPMGGRLLVRSREGTAWRTGQRGLVLTVADTGTGMSAATKKRIFDAFFTTKGIGGTGLGLWLSMETVLRHKGSLRVRSTETEDRSGTVFTLFLPFDVPS